MLLLQLSGVVLTVTAIALSAVIYWVIDPKLRAVSTEYEADQAKYLEDLERNMRWQDDTRRAEEG